MKDRVCSEIKLYELFLFRHIELFKYAYVPPVESGSAAERLPPLLHSLISRLVAIDLEALVKHVSLEQVYAFT